MRPSRSYIEDHIHLNINKLSKKIQKQPITLSWGWELPSKKTASVRITLSEDCVILNYRYRSTDDWQPIQQHIRLSTTPCHLGGRRYWFHCPQCERRVGCLIQAQMLFLCQHCSGLHFRCQSESYFNRLLRRQNKIEQHIFGKNSKCKTKWLHSKTYKQKLKVINAIEKECILLFLKIQLK